MAASLRQITCQGGGAALKVCNYTCEHKANQYDYHQLALPYKQSVDQVWSTQPSPLDSADSLLVLTCHRRGRSSGCGRGDGGTKPAPHVQVQQAASGGRLYPKPGILP